MGRLSGLSVSAVKPRTMPVPGHVQHHRPAGAEMRPQQRTLECGAHAIGRAQCQQPRVRDPAQRDVPIPTSTSGASAGSSPRSHDPVVSPARSRSHRCRSSAMNGHRGEHRARGHIPLPTGRRDREGIALASDIGDTLSRSIDAPRSHRREQRVEHRARIDSCRETVSRLPPRARRHAQLAEERTARSAGNARNTRRRCVAIRPRSRVRVTTGS
jgi:hypothetical protein